VEDSDDFREHERVPKESRRPWSHGNVVLVDPIGGEKRKWSHMLAEIGIFD
jgi:hypothetical protein